MAGSTKLRLLESAITFLRRVLKPKSVIRPFYVLFYNCLQSFVFYKLSFACFQFAIARYYSLKTKQNPFF